MYCRPTVFLLLLAAQPGGTAIRQNGTTSMIRHLAASRLSGHSILDMGTEHGTGFVSNYVGPEETSRKWSADVLVVRSTFLPARKLASSFRR